MLSQAEITGPKDAKFLTTANEIRVNGTVPNGALYTIMLLADTAFSALRLDILPQKDDSKQWPEHGAVVGHIWMKIEDPAKVAAGKIEAEKIKAKEKALDEAEKTEAAADKDGKKDEKKREPEPLPTATNRNRPRRIRRRVFRHAHRPLCSDESLKPGWAGGPAFPKLIGPRWLVFVPKEPVKVPTGATLCLLLKHEVFDAETKGSIVHHFKLSTSSAPAWTQVATAPERAELQKRLSEARKIRDPIPSASSLAMDERPDDARHETRVILRGNFPAKDKTVEAARRPLCPSFQPDARIASLPRAGWSAPILRDQRRSEPIRTPQHSRWSRARF